MKLKVPEKSSGAFIPCPAGTHNAVCVDCVEIKDVERSYGGKTWKEDQVRFTFQVEKRISEADVQAKLKAMAGAAPEQIESAKKLAGQRFGVRTFGMKQSMHDKAGLRKFVQAWLGRDFKVGEELDPETLVGVPCFLTVVHKMGGEHNDRVYANIGGIAPIMVDGETGQPLKAPIAPENYVREKDRDAAHAGDGAGEAPDDTDVPF